jgi:hypothetical protein
VNWLQYIFWGGLLLIVIVQPGIMMIPIGLGGIVLISIVCEKIFDSDGVFSGNWNWWQHTIHAVSLVIWILIAFSIMGEIGR